MEIERISSLQLGAPGSPIQVRVLRMWKARGRSDDTCYLLVDLYGDAVQAIVNKKDLAYVSSRITLLSCYQIEGYVCAPVNTYVTVVKHAINLRVGAAATIVPIPDNEHIPRLYFNFCSNEDIDAICGDNQRTLDFIGILGSMEDRRTQDGNPFVRLTLKNSSCRTIDAALWKETILSPDKWDRHAIDITKKNNVLALTSVRVVAYLGHAQINSTPATYVYVNPDTAETDVLLHSILDSICTYEDSGSTSIVLTENRTTIASLIQKEQHELAGKTYTCIATVTDIVTDKNWFYNACPQCSQTVFDSAGKWACQSHGKYNEPKYMYHINVNITDPTGTATVTLFDDAVNDIFEIPCSDFIIKEGYDATTTIPPQIHSIKGKPKKFYVQGYKEMRSNIFRGTVNRITDATLDTSSTTTTPPTIISLPTQSQPTSSTLSLQTPPPVTASAKRSLSYPPDISTETKKPHHHK